MIPNSLITNPIIIREAIKYYQKTKLEDRWDRFIKVSEKPQRQYRVMLREVFANQLDDILGNLKRKSVKADQSIGYVDENQLADWNQYRIVYNEFGQLTLPGIMGAWADLELQALEVGISFDVLNPNVMSAVTNRTNLFSDSVINETRNLLHTVINDSMNVGDGIRELTAKIQFLYEKMSKYRATRIARTEAIWALNEGAEQGYIQSGVVEFKQWWCARDERTCPWCSEMGNKDPLKVGENYFNQGERMSIEQDGKARVMTFNYEPIKHPPLHPHCYSDDTEIYTKDGWKLIKDTQINEFVLSLNPLNKHLEWCQVVNTVTRRADKMYHITNKQKSFDMLVTKDHPFFIYKRIDHDPNGRYIEPRWVEGIANLNSESQFYLSSCWTGISSDKIIIRGIEFDTKQFCKFMGYYLSEGSTTKRKRGTKSWYQISISQSHYLQEMWDGLQGLPVRKMYLGKDRIIILDEEFAEYLVQFGKSYEKYVPDIIKQFSPVYIEIFLNAFRMGDGTIKKSKKWKSGNFEDSITYTTCSKRLSDDIGELIIKSGKSVSYKFNEVKDRECKFKNGTYIINHNTWTVSELTSQYRMFKNMQIKEVDYNKEVYDLGVEKHHTILTRRNGKVVWGSNCRCTLLPIVFEGAKAYIWLGSWLRIK